MKWITLPTGENKPAWAGLFAAVSMLFVFVDPYQRHAPWIEWMWTGLAFAIFLALCTVGLIYWSRRRVILRVLIAMALLAAAFTAYRPSGIAYFVLVAGFAPLAVGGNITRSGAIISGVVLLILAEWWLFWPPSMMPYVIALEAFLVGGALTFVARQQTAVRQLHKTAERERIARDLHDILGHSLSVIILKSELTSRLLGSDPARAKAEIEDVERISRNALSDVRDAIAGYRTGNLLTEFDHAQSTLEAAGIVVERQCEAVTMPVTRERVLALVVREAVTNVLRHAHATRCRMTMQETSSAYHLEIRDDGRGGAHQEGMGMRGIRERVTAIGGEVSWSAGPGTILTIVIPIAANAGGDV
jgi:two-component system sensor histidine kinase DesK